MKKTGDAGKAAKAIVRYLKEGKSDQGYIGGWSDDNIVGGYSSRNIPLLRAAADLIKASFGNDLKVVDLQEKAWVKYCERKLCHGEDISPIYLRWIALPVLVAYRVFSTHKRNTGADAARKWLRSLCAILALSSGNAKSFKGSSHSKKPGTVLQGVPATAIVGARGWSEGDGGNLVWISGMPMCSWFAWALGWRSAGQIKGGDGWLVDAMVGLEKRFPAKHFLSDEEVSSMQSLITQGVVGNNLKLVASYVQNFPGEQDSTLWIVRRSNGVFSFWGRTFHTGSTDFCHAKVYKDGKMEVYGTANPNTRGKDASAKATWDRSNNRLFLKASDNRYWSFDQNKMVEGTVEVPLPSGQTFWVVRINSEGIEVEGLPGPPPLPPPPPPPPPTPPPLPGDPVDDKLIDKIVDAIMKYVDESGLLDKLIAKLIERLLGKLGQ